MLSRSIGIRTHLRVDELVGASLSISVHVSAERTVERGAHFSLGWASYSRVLTHLSSWGRPVSGEARSGVVLLANVH